jgi:hypothetical protein
MAQSTEPFITRKLESIIPGAVKLRDRLSHAGGIAQSRYTGVIAPVSAGPYTAGGSGAKQISFKLSSADYIDPQSLVLSFYAKGDNAAATEVGLDEGAMSIFQQVSVRVGGQSLYTLVDLPLVLNTVVGATMPSEVYQSEGPAMGLYRHSKAFGAARYKLDAGNTAGETAMPGAWELVQPGAAGTPRYWDCPEFRAAREAAGKRLTKGSFYSIPVAWLLGGMDKLLCLRNLASVEIDLLLASSVQACCVSTKLDGSVPAQVPTAVQISEVELRADFIRLSPQAYQLFDSEVMSGAGVTYPLSVWQTIPYSINNSSTSPTTRSFAVSQPYRWLRNCMAVTRLQQDINSFGASASKLGCHGFSSFQITLNGQAVPQMPLTKVFDAYNETRKALGMLNSVVGSSVMDYVRYRGPPGNIALDNVPAPSRDGTWWGAGPQDPALFVPCISFQTFLHSTEADLDGTNLQDSGSMLQVQLGNAPCTASYAADGTSCTPVGANGIANVILEHNVILSIAGGQVTVER